MNKMRYSLGIDQDGNKYYIRGDNPKKELMEQLHRKSAVKMYIDDIEGNSHHIGYIVGRHWITLYAPMRLPA